MRWWQKILVYGGVFIVAFVVGVLFINYILMPWFVHLGREISVPKVVGMSKDEAYELLRGKKLRLKVVEERYSEKPYGEILEQHPPAGSMVKAGRWVKVVMSKGAEEVEVPELVGMEVSEARRFLLRYGIGNVVVEEVVDENALPGVVVKTVPPAGVKIKFADPVSLFVSVQPPDTIKGYRMPDLVGKKYREVRTPLQKMGLAMEIEFKESSGEDGLILFQFPPAGVPVMPGDTVKIVVNIHR